MTKSKKAYLWVTLAFFGITLTGQWVAGWWVHVHDQEAHGEAPDAGDYTLEMAMQTLENWQSEFLQLAWQVAGLSLLWYVGSPQSKEGDERKEAKLDALLEKAYGEKDSKKIREDLEKQFPKA